VRRGEKAVRLLRNQSMSHSVNIGAVLDAFDLLIMLGEGDQGQVWLARDGQHPRKLIAVKLLNPGAGTVAPL
jgi:hypothetical protein